MANISQMWPAGVNGPKDARQPLYNGSIHQEGNLLWASICKKNGSAFVKLSRWANLRLTVKEAPSRVAVWPVVRRRVDVWRFCIENLIQGVWERPFISPKIRCFCSFWFVCLLFPSSSIFIYLFYSPCFTWPLRLPTAGSALAAVYLLVAAKNTTLKTNKKNEASRTNLIGVQIVGTWAPRLCSAASHTDWPLAGSTKIKDATFHVAAVVLCSRTSWAPSRLVHLRIWPRQAHLTRLRLPAPRYLAIVPFGCSNSQTVSAFAK